MMLEVVLALCAIILTTVMGWGVCVLVRTTRSAASTVSEVGARVSAMSQSVEDDINVVKSKAVAASRTLDRAREVVSAFTGSVADDVTRVRDEAVTTAEAAQQAIATTSADLSAAAIAGAGVNVITGTLMAVTQVVVLGHTIGKWRARSHEGVTFKQSLGAFDFLALVCVIPMLYTHGPAYAKRAWGWVGAAHSALLAASKAGDMIDVTKELFLGSKKKVAELSAPISEIVGEGVKITQRWSSALGGDSLTDSQKVLADSATAAQWRKKQLERAQRLAKKAVVTAPDGTELDVESLDDFDTSEAADPKHPLHWTLTDVCLFCHTAGAVRAETVEQLQGLTDNTTLRADKHGNVWCRVCANVCHDCSSEFGCPVFISHSTTQAELHAHNVETLKSRSPAWRGAYSEHQRNCMTVTAQVDVATHALHVCACLSSLSDRTRQMCSEVTASDKPQLEDVLADGGADVAGRVEVLMPPHDGRVATYVRQGVTYMREHIWMALLFLAIIVASYFWYRSPPVTDEGKGKTKRGRGRPGGARPRAMKHRLRRKPWVDYEDGQPVAISFGDGKRMVLGADDWTKDVKTGTIVLSGKWGKLAGGRLQSLREEDVYEQPDDDEQLDVEKDPMLGIDGEGRRQRTPATKFKRSLDASARSKFVCHHCKKKGHIRPECPDLGKKPAGAEAILQKRAQIPVGSPAKSVGFVTSEKGDVTTEMNATAVWNGIVFAHHFVHTAGEHTTAVFGEERVVFPTSSAVRIGDDLAYVLEKHMVGRSPKWCENVPKMKVGKVALESTVALVAYGNSQSAALRHAKTSTGRVLVVQNTVIGSTYSSVNGDCGACVVNEHGQLVAVHSATDGEKNYAQRLTDEVRARASLVESGVKPDF